MEFATIPFEDIIKRLLRSNHDCSCFEKLAYDHYPENDIQPAIRKYEECNAANARGLLMEVAEECLRDAKYRDYENSEEVILSGICNSDIPRRSFNEIFGHEEDERSCYPTAERLLRRHPDLQDTAIIDTSSWGRIREVRYADFTIVREKLFGGHEIYSVDVKFRPAAFQTFLDQAHDFSLFSKYTLLMSTAGLVLDLAGKWRMRPLRALKHFVDACDAHGVGIIIFDSNAGKLRDLSEASGSSRVDAQIRRRALEELGLSG